MQEISVSVILATFNGNKKWISESIESVLNQSYSNFEFIIINDASTNNIEKIILSYVEKDNRIIYIRNKTNLERSASRNIGIQSSRGKYIALIDDDDIWCDTHKLACQIEYMENNPHYGICGSGVILIDEFGVEKNRIHVRESDEHIRKNILGSNQFALSSVLIQKNILDQSGLFSFSYSLAEDYELWLRIGMYSKFCNLPDFLIKYRDRISSTSNKNQFQLKRNLWKIYFSYSKYYPHRMISFFRLLCILVVPKNIITLISVYAYRKK